MEGNELKTLISQYLCPPGDGVFTVHTAREKKAKLQNLLYPNSADLKASWQQALDDLLTQPGPAILGMASDNGGGILRGANWGPLFVREHLYTHYHDLNFHDLGDVRVIPHLLHDKYLNQETIASCQKALYGEVNDLAVSPLSIAKDCLTHLYATHPEIKIFGIGGDHSCSYPLVKTALEAQLKQGKRCALLHFDAHTDLLEQRLGVDLCFGSWTYHILEALPTPAHLIQVGIRSTGSSKEFWQEKYGLKQIWANDVQTQGAEQTAKEIIDHYKALNVDTLYITFDIDTLDINFASATGTPETDGLTVDESVTIIQACCKSFNLIGADLMEVSPFVSHGLVQEEPQMTLASAGTIASTLIRGF